MRKIDVEVCVGNCSHLQDSNSILTFFHSLSRDTKSKIDLDYNLCRNCGNGPRVKVGNKLINKANPQKVFKEFIKKNIPVSNRVLKNY